MHHQSFKLSPRRPERVKEPTWLGDCGATGWSCSWRAGWVSHRSLCMCVVTGFQRRWGAPAGRDTSLERGSSLSGTGLLYLCCSAPHIFTVTLLLATLISSYLRWISKVTPEKQSQGWHRPLLHNSRSNSGLFLFTCSVSEYYVPRSGPEAAWDDGTCLHGSIDANAIIHEGLIRFNASKGKK